MAIDSKNKPITTAAATPPPEEWDAANPARWVDRGEAEYMSRLPSFDSLDDLARR